MSDSKQKWDEVGDRFTALGRKLKTHYDENTNSKPETEPTQDALRQIGDALDAGFTAIGESFRDTQMRDELKSAGVAITDALSASLDDVKNAINKQR
jgi:hypothetical protein